MKITVSSHSAWTLKVFELLYSFVNKTKLAFSPDTFALNTWQKVYFECYTKPKRHAMYVFASPVVLLISDSHSIYVYLPYIFQSILNNYFLNFPGFAFLGGQT